MNEMQVGGSRVSTRAAGRVVFWLVEGLSMVEMPMISSRIGVREVEGKGWSFGGAGRWRREVGLRGHRASGGWSRRACLSLADLLRPRRRSVTKSIRESRVGP